MKKYLFIDTWNGEGYSDSKAFTEELKDDLAANLKVIEVVKESMPDDGTMQLINIDYTTDWCKTMGFVKEAAELVGYQYTGEDLSDEDSTFDDCENSGSVTCVGWSDDIVGVIVSPNVNDYQIIRVQEEWDSVVETVKEMSEEYKDEQEIYGTCHHSMDNGNDWILFEKSDLEISKLPHQEEDFSERELENEYEFFSGDGVEKEIWKHKSTEELIEINLDLVRYFQGKRL